MSRQVGEEFAVTLGVHPAAVLELIQRGAQVICYKGSDIHTFLEESKSQGAPIESAGFRDYAGEDFIIVWRSSLYLGTLLKKDNT